MFTRVRVTIAREFRRLNRLTLGMSVCALALKGLSVPRNSIIGAVFLFGGENLAPLKIAEADRDRVLAGNDGVVGTALRRGEPALTDNPYQDPELQEHKTFSGCLTAVCVPLRTGYQLLEEDGYRETIETEVVQSQ
ncbi:MAG: hypothetical protein ACK2UT_04615 [Candidatus Promineifilaceae bacterium]|jgi:hypothetical protein